MRCQWAGYRCSARRPPGLVRRFWLVRPSTTLRGGTWEVVTPSPANYKRRLWQHNARARHRNYDAAVDIKLSGQPHRHGSAQFWGLPFRPRSTLRHTSRSETTRFHSEIE